MSKIRYIFALLTAVAMPAGSALAQNQPPTLTTIYNFSGTSDGANPSALAIGQGGILYGTTLGGGMGNAGTIFSLTPPASPGASWSYTVLYSFPNADNGGPSGRLVIDSGGVLYGGTAWAGSTQGSVFSLIPPAPGSASSWTLTTLCIFPQEVWPTGLALGPAGALYGTTNGGGGANSSVFQLLPPAEPGQQWTLSYLVNLAGFDGAGPNGVVVGGGGVLYGTTEDTVFAMVPPVTGGSPWPFDVIHTFTFAGYGGEDARTGVVIGEHSLLFGTTSAGGTEGGGTVYMLVPPTTAGVAWNFVVLYQFATTPSGNGPEPGPLALGKNNTIYGTTVGGGASLDGTAYVLKPPATPGNPWTDLSLHIFTGSDGASPTGLVIGTGGVLYGTTASGGAYGQGTIFALTE